jgi:hypothetical protein
VGDESVRTGGSVRFGGVLKIGSSKKLVWVKVWRGFGEEVPGRVPILNALGCVLHCYIEAPQTMLLLQLLGADLNNIGILL